MDMDILEAGSRHDPSSLNPLEAPPKQFQELFKYWRYIKQFGDQDKVSKQALDHGYRPDELREVSSLDSAVVLQAFNDFLRYDSVPGSSHATEIQDVNQCRVYTSDKIKGLYVLPDLLSLDVQHKLISCLLHRDLSNPTHKTNLHMHYNIPYPSGNGSFFTNSASISDFTPKDPEIHKPLSVERVLNSKLRWMTLGGQYDWTKKAYPNEEPPPFPPDISTLVKTIFPSIEPQAAILNVYHPRDTLSMHRDVSEKTDRGLASISLGLACIFIIGVEDGVSGEVKSHVLHLKSGDTVLMTQEARFAWHGVPSILAGTSPSGLAEWPGEEYAGWGSWMKDKRVNLNIRQMHETPIN